MSNITRREAILRLGGFVAGLGAAGSLVGQTTATAESTSGTAGAAAPAKPFSIAHITDVHMTHERGAAKWFRECLHQLQAHPSKPAFILNTGDCIMDGTVQSKADTEKQWALYNEIVKNENGLPMHTILGNHDVWGLKIARDKPEAKDPLFGKVMARQQLGLDKLYYSFDHSGWHFVMLDTIEMDPAQAEWRGNLGKEQFKWLADDLKATPPDTPTIICTHIPIIEVCTLLFQGPDERGGYFIDDNHMMADARELIDLFKKHPNVKLCLSGHIHKQDKIDLGGVTYICDGSVCGSKWLPLAPNAAVPGYSIINLHPDGRFEHEYLTFGWKANA